LKQLEEQAGIALVSLVGRKLQLTPAGQQLLQARLQLILNPNKSHGAVILALRDQLLA
jgi:DNA-binding transcriptional LysR family regulator